MRAMCHSEKQSQYGRSKRNWPAEVKIAFVLFATGASSTPCAERMRKTDSSSNADARPMANSSPRSTTTPRAAADGKEGHDDGLRNSIERNEIRFGGYLALKTKGSKRTKRSNFGRRGNYRIILAHSCARAQRQRGQSAEASAGSRRSYLGRIASCYA